MSTSYREISSILDNNIVVVNIPELGYKIHYKMAPETFLYREFINDQPHFSSAINLEFIKLVKDDNGKNQEFIKKFFNDADVIPKNIKFKKIYVGFVFGNEGDKNNHRWWLDFRDNDNQNIYNYFCDNLIIDCPVTTTRWHDSDPNGTWHGRMVINSNELDSIKEPDNNKILIKGNTKTKYRNDINSIKLPANTKFLRIRYNIREDIWFCDVLDNNHNELETIPCKNLICNVKLVGTVKEINKKYKVSTLIDIDDVDIINIAINNLMILGKIK